MPAVDHHGWGPEIYTDYHASWVLVWVYSQKIYMSHRRSGRKPKPFLAADICRSMDSKIPDIKSKNVCRGSAFTQPLHFSRHNCSFCSLSEKQMANHTIKVSVKQAWSQCWGLWRTLVRHHTNWNKYVLDQNQGRGHKGQRTPSRHLMC